MTSFFLGEIQRVSPWRNYRRGENLEELEEVGKLAKFSFRLVG